MGENATFLRNVNGDLYAMGTNSYGELGIGNTTSPITVPTQLPGNWKHVSIDWWHAAGIRTDGSLWVWGSSSSGQLGIGSNTSQSSPVQVGTDLNWVNAVTSMYSTTVIKQV
jgi:alpha-tubulin suppressor-like RCC1 family protein